MKCDKCGNEFLTGTFCPNCGAPVTVDPENVTMASDQEVENPIPDSAQSSNVVEETNSAVFGQNAPRPEDNIYSEETINPYAGQPNNMNGNQPNNIYGNQPNNMNGNQPNNMYGNQPNNMYGNQPNNMYGNQPNNMYGNQPNNMYGNQPNNMYGNQPNNMYGNQPNNMYGNQINNTYGNQPNNINGSQPNNSKKPLIIAGVSIGVAIIAIVLLLVLVVLRKDDKDDQKDLPTTTEAITAEDTEVPDTEAPTIDDTEEVTEETTEESSTNEPISSGTLEGTVVYDDNNVQLTVVSVDYSYGYLSITGQVENKTDKHVKLASQAVALNGISLDGYMSSDVTEKSSADWSLGIYDSDIASTGIKKITDFTMYFEAYDADYNVESGDYDTVSLGNFTYEIDIDTMITPKYDFGRFTDVYEDEYCVITACKDIVYDEDLDAYYTVLCVENKLDVPVSLMLTDTFINGVEIPENLGWNDVIPKSVVYSELYWYTDDLTAECMTFKDIEMEVDIFDYNDWSKDYTITTISYQTDGVAK